MTVRVRFAPSPTGRLHVGNARTALLNYLFARKEGGEFVLRIDDTDRERSTKEYEDGIVQDLAWLGLAHDAFLRQSERFHIYAQAIEELKARGLLYPCYETAQELELKRKVQLGRGQPPVYDRAALKLTDAQKQEFAARNTSPHWRFLLPHESIAWRDLVHGEVAIHTQTLSDPVLLRADGQPLYTLPSICDDIGLGISHVIRGEDHLTNTAVQIALFRALGAEPPHFAHFPLLTGAGGENLSKRFGSLSVESLRREGLEPMALNSLLARLGTSDPVEPRQRLEELAAGFDLTHIGRASVKFDPQDLRLMNARILHGLPYTGAEARLKAIGVGGGAPFWEMARANLTLFSEAAEWWRVAAGPVAPVIAESDADFVAEAESLLPAADFSDSTWGAWTKAVTARTGRKGRDLFLPLRLALTGLDHGPEMKSLLVFIGPERAHARLRGERA
ncbi:MAG TPA: glutamate--tRNA ligase [Alphaproteobacteria bacterium]|jgi:glutamyl-tRNA synthetase|nr:glutamate--tRNA ligase [Alphaproteobacteria bacterium]